MDLLLACRSNYFMVGYLRRYIARSLNHLPANSLVCLCDIIVTNLYMLHFGPVDLKKKYNAKWALVTGAGTGIGKSIAETMALQGLNVVLVSLPDKVYFSLHNSFFKINN